MAVKTPANSIFTLFAGVIISVQNIYRKPAHIDAFTYLHISIFSYLHVAVFSLF